MQRPPANPLIDLLVHVACCGGLLLVIAVVAGALALTEALAIVAVIGALAATVVLWTKRRRACVTRPTQLARPADESPRGAGAAGTRAGRSEQTS